MVREWQLVALWKRGFLWLNQIIACNLLIINFQHLCLCLVRVLWVLILLFQRIVQKLICFLLDNEHPSRQVPSAPKRPSWFDNLLVGSCLLWSLWLNGMCLLCNSSYSQSRFSTHTHTPSWHSRAKLPLLEARLTQLFAIVCSVPCLPTLLSHRCSFLQGYVTNSIQPNQLLPAIILLQNPFKAF